MSRKIAYCSTFFARLQTCSERFDFLDQLLTASSPEGVMGLSKTEVNLKRLLVTAPQQQNQAKLIHYVATLRELLEQLADERNSDGLPRSICFVLFQLDNLKKTLCCSDSSKSSG
ncbi:hypothetical protein MTR67_008802, partial [Solanum verrucosum]